MSTYKQRLQGAKYKRRKPRYIRFDSPWTGRHKETQAVANRRVRRRKMAVAAPAPTKVTPDQGKQEVAGNRCGNECGRRSLRGDYLCGRCRE